MAHWTERDNDCVGCETCVNCGRKEDYYVTYTECDECKDDDAELFEYKGKELCASCLLKEWVGLADRKEIYDILSEIEIEEDDSFLNMFNRVEVESN